LAILDNCARFIPYARSEAGDGGIARLAIGSG
jgi:hypothetical protein